jgi:hypothetical protein
MARERNGILLWSGIAAVVLGSIGISVVSSCGDLNCPIPPCGPPGFDPETCKCRPADVGPADAGEGGAFACHAPVDCATIECDLIKATTNVCGAGALHTSRRECTDGIVAIDSFGVDTGSTSYYKASMLIAVVGRSANFGGMTSCPYGPSRFDEPVCGDPMPLCASDAGPEHDSGGE